MTIATKYNVSVAWRTLASQVFQLTRADVNNPATYRMTVAAIDSNNPGARTKAIGYYLVDFWGVPYLIIGTTSTTVDVQDDFRVGRCPTSGQMAVIYKAVYNGRAFYLGQVDFQHLHPLAFNNYHRFEIAITWSNDPNAKKVPFTASAFPKIENYQADQVDPEDAAKTINYAEDFGENPNIRLIISVDATSGYQQQQMVLFTYVGGLINTAGFDIGEGNEQSGYISISRS